MRKLFAALACVAVLGVSAGQGIDVTKTFARILPSLQSRVKFAVLLPARLPASFRGEKIYPIVDRAASTGYAIDIALAPDCQGERACSEGFIYGSKTALKAAEVPPGGTPVRLSSAIVALYHASQVGAHTSDAYLSWKQGGANYAIALNTGSLADMLLAARSMR